ncbi:MAG: LysR family transcriptional regulator, partial [Rhodobacterales bacterium]
MPRNLDLAALRSFVTVADVGGVTKAAGYLNLTQSAVSMQIKRLEESLGMQLFLRAARKLALSPEGEQLVSYGRRMLALNDEVLSRFTTAACCGPIRLGVPHDVVYPAIPGILRRMAQAYPMVQVNLVSSFTILMKEGFARGEFDVMLTTEETPDPGAEVLGARALVWVGAPEGSAWQRRPLRLGFKDTCIFRPRAQAA